MMTLHGFDVADLVPVPWKNGGGTTREIVCVPRDAGFDRFAWRASIATIAGDAAFSIFPGVDRVIALLHGPAVHLHGTGGTGHRLDLPAASLAFDGAAAVRATLLGPGAACVLNVMTRRGTWAATIRVVRDAQALPRATGGVLYVAAGAWCVESDASGVAVWSKGQGGWWDGCRGPVRLTPRVPASVLLAALLTRASDQDSGSAASSAPRDV